MRRRLRTTDSFSAADEPIVNLTPLIDVVFVVLIMFILVAPLLEIDEVILADATSTKTTNLASFQDERTISIAVHNDNTIYLNKQVMTVAALRSALKDAHERTPSIIPLIVHDARAQFGTYQDVKGAVESAGFPQMDVVLKPS